LNPTLTGSSIWRPSNGVANHARRWAGQHMYGPGISTPRLDDVEAEMLPESCFPDLVGRQRRIEA